LLEHKTYDQSLMKNTYFNTFLILFFLLFSRITVAQTPPTSFVIDSLQVLVEKTNDACLKAKEMSFLADEWVNNSISFSGLKLNEVNSFLKKNDCAEAKCWAKLVQIRILIRKQELDSAGMLLEQLQSEVKPLQNIALNMAIERRMAGYYHRMNNSEQAMVHFDNCEKMARGNKNMRELFLVKLGKADNLMSKSKMTETLAICKTITDSISNVAPDKLCEVYALMGRCYADLGDVKKSFDAYQLGIQYGEKYRNGSIGRVYRNFAILQSQMGDLDNAMDKFEKSLKFETMVGNKGGIVLSLEGISGIFAQKNQLVEAEKKLLDAIEIGKNGVVPSDMITIWGNLGQVQIELKKYDEAKKSLTNCLILSEKFNNKSYQTSVLSILGQLELELKNNEKAISYLKKAEELMGETEIYEAKMGLLQNLSEAYSNVGNFAQAYKYQKSLFDLRDTVFSKDRLQTVRDLEAKYQSEQKDKTLALNEAELTAKTATIDRQKAWSYTFGLGLLMTGLLAYSWYRSSMRFRSFNRELKEAKKKSDDLLLNILPASVAEELKINQRAKSLRFENATVLCTDFKDFTGISERMEPEALVALIDDYFRAFDAICLKFGVEKIKTIGDAYLCVGGLPDKEQGKPLMVIKAAHAFQQVVEQLKKEKSAAGLPFFECRIGIHTGAVVAGIVGANKFQYDIWGDTVNVATRMEQVGEVGKINISAATFELVKNDLTAQYRGEIPVKGKGEVGMYFLNEIN
jgi:adenylate cyclase